jgi:hypothetical protein
MIQDKKLHKVTEMLLHKLVPETAVMNKTHPDSTDGARYVNTHGEFFVNCYRKTTNGVLFFLPEGYAMLTCVCIMYIYIHISLIYVDSVS